MSAAIIPLKGEVSENLRRDLFAKHAADSFDNYVAANGHEPDALMMLYGGVKQPVRTSYLILGESERGVTSMMSLASVAYAKAAMGLE